MFAIFYITFSKKVKVEIENWKTETEKESIEEIHNKKGKHPWIIGTLTVYHCFSLTEFLPSFFLKLKSFPPERGAFCQNNYPFENG